MNLGTDLLLYNGVRPHEIGCSEEFVKAAASLKIPMGKYDLNTQFRCGGSSEYVNWVDRMLGFDAPDAINWAGRYSFELVDGPAQLDQMMAQAREKVTRARLVAGFSWKWSEVRADGSLEPDVKIGDWERPWNAKVPKGKAAPRPEKHPYPLWANTPIGEGQVGCIYSAQGFEFDSVGVSGGLEPVWRTDRWVAQPKESRDSPVRNAGENMLDLVRNAYRVLLTRGIRETRVLCLDPKTRDHLAKLAGPAAGGRTS